MLKVKEILPEKPAGGLAELEKVRLGHRYQQMLEGAAATCGGPRFWRDRKGAMTRNVLALAEISPRFGVQNVDMRETLKIRAMMRVPVPLRPDADGRLRVANTAQLTLIYPQEALRQPLPGYSFVEMVRPLGVWHANCSAEPVQLLCLGAELPAGIRLTNIVLMTYGALSMQTTMLDERDAAGVMNPDAARWWQENTALTPLSQALFLGPDGPDDRD